MANDTNKNNGESAPQLPREPHLLTVNDFAEVAVWLVAAAGSGAIGNAAYDLLGSLRRRFGRSRLDELKLKVLEEVEAADDEEEGSKDETRARISALFDEYE